MFKEKIYDVYWEGSFRWEERKNLTNLDHVLYSLHGTHSLYGQNVLLYIGKTSVNPKNRFWGHGSWIKEEYDEMTIKVASIGKFTNWKDWKNYGSDTYPSKLIDVDVIDAIETLLIFAHQPAYNTANKGKAKKAEGIRIFNTGKLGQLFPEVSYYYHIGYK
jgi:hypothetical protein